MLSVNKINQLQKTIDTKNGVIAVLKDTVKKWVGEYNALDACCELASMQIKALQNENERLIKRLAKRGEMPITITKQREQYKDCLRAIKEITSGTYEALDSQALQEIRQKLSEAENV